MKAKFFKILAITLPLFTSCGKSSVSPVPFSWPFDPDASYRVITKEMTKVENFIKEAEKEENKLYVEYYQGEWYRDCFDNDNLFITEFKQISFQSVDNELVDKWADEKNAFIITFSDMDYCCIIKENITNMVIYYRIPSPSTPGHLAAIRGYTIAEESGQKLVQAITSIIDEYTSQE